MEQQLAQMMENANQLLEGLGTRMVSVPLPAAKHLEAVGLIRQDARGQWVWVISGEEDAE